MIDRIGRGTDLLPGADADRGQGPGRERGPSMTMTMVDSPLLRTTRDSETDYWNDSCAVDELTYAIDRGATGATSNPSIVLEVLKKEKAHGVLRVRELAATN